MCKHVSLFIQECLFFSVHCLLSCKWCEKVQTVIDNFITVSALFYMCDTWIKWSSFLMLMINHELLGLSSAWFSVNSLTSTQMWCDVTWCHVPVRCFCVSSVVSPSRLTTLVIPPARWTSSLFGWFLKTAFRSAAAAVSWIWGLGLCNRSIRGEIPFRVKTWDTHETHHHWSPACMISHVFKQMWKEILSSEKHYHHRF